MIFKRSLQQLLRKPRLVLLYGSLLCLLTAMLSIGLLLMQSSVSLAQQAEDGYDTIGVVEYVQNVPIDTNYFYMKAQLDLGVMIMEEYLEGKALYEKFQKKNVGGYEEYRYPTLRDSISHMAEEKQEALTQVEGYDLTPLLDSPYVVQYEDRARYGAYIPGLADGPSVRGNYAVNDYDVLIFTYTGAEPLLLDWDFCSEDPETGDFMPIREVAVKVVSSHMADRIGADFFYEEQSLPMQFDLRASTDTLGTLEPGKTYITLCSISRGMTDWRQLEGEGWESTVDLPAFTAGFYRTYDASGRWEQVAPLTTAPTDLLVEYTEDFWNTDAGRRFDAIRSMIRVNNDTAAVMTTNDLQLILPFHNEELYARQGRLFTGEECRQGGGGLCGQLRSGTGKRLAGGGSH